MSLINRIAVHRESQAEGRIVAIDDRYVRVAFGQTEKTFVTETFLTYFTGCGADLEAFVAEVRKKHATAVPPMPSEPRPDRPQSRRDRPLRKAGNRKNIAFKCTYCDGGKSDDRIGFHGVCSEDMIRYNTQKAKHVWCSAPECPCRRLLDGKMSRRELEDAYRQDPSAGIVCYESRMLLDWRASAGVVQTGIRKGAPMAIRGVREDSLCILTTRSPDTDESMRFIFAVFLVDRSYEGGETKEGSVSTQSGYRISLSPAEAPNLLFWQYHANESHPERPAWNSGLHRFVTEESALRILQEIVRMKRGTADEALAKSMLGRFRETHRLDDDAPAAANDDLRRQDR